MNLPTEGAYRLPGRESAVPWFLDKQLTVVAGQIVRLPRNDDCMPTELVRLMAWTAERLSGSHQFNDREAGGLVDIHLLASVDVTFEGYELGVLHELKKMRHLGVVDNDEAGVWMLVTAADPKDSSAGDIIWSVEMDRVRSVSVRAERIGTPDLS